MATAAAVPVSRTQPGIATRFLKHPLALLGLLLLTVLLLVAATASGNPAVSLKDGLNGLGVPHAPGPGFPLGADTLGRDVWCRVAFGARISLTVAVCAMLTSVVIGTTIGLVGGFYGGWVDSSLTRLTEIVSSLPTILLAFTLAFVLPDDLSKLWLYVHLHSLSASVFGPQSNSRIAGLLNFVPDSRFIRLLAAIGLVTWTGIARAVRGQTLALKEREFVEAARAMGCSNETILSRHLLPNVLPTVVTLATLATANNILLEAGLSYLTLGVDPASPSWGGMISDGQPYLVTAPWIVLVPGFAIVLAVTAFNMLGTALQEVLDPGR